MNRLEREQTPWSGAVAPDSRYLGADNVTDLLRDCAQMGLIEELRAKLGQHAKPDQQAALQAVRNLVYELAGAETATSPWTCSFMPPAWPNSIK